MTRYEYAIERVALRARACRLDDREISGYAFQRWLGEWHERQRAGWNVTVLLGPDETYAIALGYVATEPEQLQLWSAA